MSKMRSCSFPYSFFLRSLFPSWRLFNEVGQIANLEFSLISDSNLDLHQDSNSNEVWQSALPAPSRRTWRQLFFNPEENLRLAGKSLLDQFLSQASRELVSETDKVHLEVSRKLLENWVCHQIHSELRSRGKAFSSTAPQFRFRIYVDSDLVFQSEICELR